VGTSIVKGVTMGLLVTIFTLLVVLGTNMVGVEKSIISYVVDFGLLLSCLAAGYKASRTSGRILPAGLAAGGYAVIGILLLAVYFPIEPIAALQIVAEGTGVGLIAGLFGSGLKSDYDYGGMEHDYYSYPKNRVYERKNIYEVLREGERENNQCSERINYNERKTEPSSSYLNELQKERMEDEDAFAWWKVESKKQLKR